MVDYDSPKTSLKYGLTGVSILILEFQLRFGVIVFDITCNWSLTVLNDGLKMVYMKLN